MSDYSDAIVDRLAIDTVLQNSSNSMRKVLEGTIGELLQSIDEFPFWNEFFIQESNGNYLDAWGKTFNVHRKNNENDDTYRERIILESLGHLTVDYLQKVYNLTVYCFVEDFDATENVLTSDNPYLCDKYMLFTTDEIQNILEKKFVIGTQIEFGEL